MYTALVGGGTADALKMWSVEDYVMFNDSSF